MRDNNFFADVYNKVIGFFRQAEQESHTKDVARNRLRVVLMQDRTNINPALLERMRKDLVKLLTKYLEMDNEALELNLEEDDGQMALMLSIPVIRAKDEDEIEEESCHCEEGTDEAIQENSDEEIDEREEELEEESEEQCLCSELECVCGDEEADQLKLTEEKEEKIKSNKKTG
ncbi:MAG: cell division topological specificity factor MinE [Heliobacteriaceae bacterium]|jgi:cell division topological specificity factor|nr:cell division topological specificity factor MinE [Heliobacteriaceae bacterium]